MCHSSTCDVTDVIKRLARWRAPGPDGLPAEFYSTFLAEVIPFLTQLFAECIEEQTLPRSFSVSRTILLFKRGDRSNLENWRPIPLMNIDEKILFAVLTTRIQKVLPSIISPMQTGFVK